MGRITLTFQLVRIIIAVTGFFLGTLSAVAIVGGNASDGSLSRSSVMVLTSNGGVCSAVIVTQDVILTAAHCATGAEQYRVHYRNSAGEPVMLEPEGKAIHPGYVAVAIKARSQSVDLALLKLKQPLPSGFSTAALSSLRPGAGSRITIGGFGITQNDNGRSSGVLRTADLAITEPYGPGKVLVWASSGERRGACNGDSGGPMAVDNSVFAVTAWAAGNRQSTCGTITQGILLGPQRQWIDRTLQGWGRQARWLD